MDQSENAGLVFQCEQDKLRCVRKEKKTTSCLHSVILTLLIKKPNDIILNSHLLDTHINDLKDRFMFYIPKTINQLISVIKSHLVGAYQELQFILVNRQHL